MRNKGYIINFIFSISILATIWVQSIHNYEHFVIKMAESHCHHDAQGKTQITHQHHSFDTCPVCNFSLTHYVESGFLKLDIRPVHYDTATWFGYSEKLICFSGSTLKTRGPPQV